MTLSRSSRLTSNPDHGPPVEVPTMGVPACEKCGLPYRWSSETGRRTKEPYGPCSGLKRSELERSPINRVSPDRDRKRADRGLDTPLKDYVEGLPCILADDPCHTCRGDVVAHHVRHKNHAGDWTERGGERVGNLVPTCDKVHSEIHDHGRETFADEHGISLAGEARRLGERWRGSHRRKEGEDGR